MWVPFTQQQFLDVFGAYKSTVWPVVIALWLVTFVCGVRLVRGQARSVTLSALAAIHWAWSGLVYHALFFTDINPAAWLFAGVFLLEAYAFVWFGMVRRTLVFEWGRTARHAVAGVLFASGARVWPRCSTGATLRRPLSNDTLYGSAAAHRRSPGSLERLRHPGHVGRNRRDRRYLARGHAGSDVVRRRCLCRRVRRAAFHPSHSTPAALLNVTRMVSAR